MKNNKKKNTKTTNKKQQHQHTKEIKNEKIYGFETCTRGDKKENANETATTKKQALAVKITT